MCGLRQHLFRQEISGYGRSRVKRALCNEVPFFKTSRTKLASTSEIPTCPDKFDLQAQPMPVPSSFPDEDLFLKHSIRHRYIKRLPLPICKEYAAIRCKTSNRSSRGAKRLEYEHIRTYYRAVARQLNRSNQYLLMADNI